MKKFVDMDGNELKVGDIVLFGTGNKRIARAKIESISEYGYLKLHTLKNRQSSAFAEYVLLDTTAHNETFDGICPRCNNKTELVNLLNEWVCKCGCRFK